MKKGTLRQGLVVFQFGLSVIFLVAIEGELVKQSNYNLFKQLASGIAGVKMVDRASETPHAMRFMVDIPDGVSNTAT